MDMKLPKIFARSILATFLMLTGWAEADATRHQESAHAEAIRVVIEQDSRLGTVRNHASEKAPIARAVEDYVAGLDALDLERCPPDFRRALRSHRDAWYDSIAFFGQHAELRGELHDVFDAIRAKGKTSRLALEALEAGILETWVEVEESMNAHLQSER
jgi:hypothetical protein